MPNSEAEEFDVLIEALKVAGFRIPDEVKTHKDGVIKGLIIAVKSNPPLGGDGGDDLDDDGLDDGLAPDVQMLSTTRAPRAPGRDARARNRRRAEAAADQVERVKKYLPGYGGTNGHANGRQ